MAKLLKLRRGTDTQHSTFTGAEGEVTVNTTNDSLHVHDGTTAGGHEVAKADLSNVDGSLSNNLGFADNTKALFGTGNDLEIYHDGSNSVIEDVATGDLILKSSSTFIRDGSNNAMVNCNAGGSVQAFHNGSQKLATTATGISVSGSVVCDSGNVAGQLNVNRLVVDDDGATSPTMVVKTDDNATTGFVIKNDSYSTNEEHGFKINQGNGGAVQVMNVGNSEYKGITFQTLNGTGGVKNAINIQPEASVDLYYNNGLKLQTQSGGINVTGTATCDGIQCDGNAFLDGDYVSFNDNGYIRGDVSGVLQYQAGSSNIHRFVDNGNSTTYLEISGGGLKPGVDDAYDIGTTTNQWRNGYFDGTVNCDGLSSEGQISVTNGDVLIGSGSGPQLRLRDTDSTGDATVSWMRGENSNGAVMWYLGDTNSDGSITLTNEQNNNLYLGTNGNNRCFVDANGHFQPYSDNTFDLGSSTRRWRNIYTGDLNLSNEGSANDVDGTWGSWTIQEGEDDLFLLNRRNGKKYKFNLSEVN